MTNTVGRGGYKTQAHFANIAPPQVERSVFDRAFSHKTTFDAGQLIPFFVDEILPGDTINLSTNALARLVTPIFPYMDSVYMDFHFFFVPNRLVWDKWEQFNGAQEDPDSQTDYTVPQLDDATHAAGFAQNSLYDYLGLPTKITSIPQANMPNALIPRAYNLIWNEWYRDENLQDSVTVDRGDGPDTTAYTVLPRGRRKDYFTSGLPWPQKGPDVVLPLGTSAPVNLTTTLGNAGKTLIANTHLPVAGGVGLVTTGGSGFLNVDGGGSAQVYDPNDTLFADLSDATAATLNEFRQAVAMQQFFERDARGGTRYVEILLGHFGVVSPDFRLQRPEFLGGGTFNVNVNPVAQTSASPAAPSATDTPQGNLSAFAIAMGRVNINHSFVEHGHVIGIVSVRAETTYQQGMNRMWSRQTRYDFAWPTFAHLGEQATLNKEIMMTGSSDPNTGDNAVHSYQERYAEYRYKPSMVTGLFRSNATNSLDAWHLAVEFANIGDAALDQIVVENPPIDRIIAIPSQPQFQFDSWNQYRHLRPLPVYGTPGLSKL